jgi:hypothetical protein
MALDGSSRNIQSGIKELSTVPNPMSVQLLMDPSFGLFRVLGELEILDRKLLRYARGSGELTTTPLDAAAREADLKETRHRRITHDIDVADGHH